MARTYGKAQDLIDYTRASSATALRRVKYGAELVTNGTFDSDATGWTEARCTAAVVSGQVVLTSTGANPLLNQTLNLTVGKVYKVEGDIIGGTGTAVPQINVQDNTFSSYGALTSSGSFVFVATTTNNYLQLRNQGSTVGDTGTYDNISVKEVTFDTSDGDLILFNHPNNIPRIEYDANGNLLGLLVEESRTNLITYSEDITVWSSYGVLSVDGNMTTSPDGQLTADSITFGSGGGYISRLQSSVVSAGSIVVGSIYVKGIAGETARLVLQTGGGTYQANTADIVFDGTWQRISVSPLTLSDTKTFVGIYLDNASGSKTVTTCYVWGGMIEQGSFPTSYIPTSGSTATRAADVASLSTSAFGYNQDHFTLAIDVKCKGRDAGDYPRLWALLVSGGQSMSLWYSDTRFYLDKATVGPVFTLTENSLIQNKIGVSYDSDSVKICVNGETVSESATSFATNAPTLYIGDTGAGNSYGSFYLKSLKYLPRFITNAQLQELTS